MSTLRRITVLLLGITVITPAMAESEWLPQEGRESLSKQLAIQVADTYLAEANDQAALEAQARNAVDDIIAIMDGWGVDEVASRAPALADLGLPESGNPLLDAIARYGACSFHLDALYRNKALDDSVPAMRVNAAVAAAAIPLTSAMLRHAFLERGGTDEDLRVFLTSPEVTAAADAIDGNRDLISYTWKECAPTLAELTAIKE